jgi:hypothetical protein
VVAYTACYHTLSTPIGPSRSALQHFSISRHREIVAGFSYNARALFLKALQAEEVVTGYHF